MWNEVKEVGTGRRLTVEEFEMTVGHSPIVQELMRRQNVEEGGNGEGVDGDRDGDGGVGGDDDEGACHMVLVNFGIAICKSELSSFFSSEVILKLTWF